MEVCAKLEIFLSEEEVNSLSESIRNKTIDHLTGVYKQTEELQNEISEINAVTERQQFQFGKDIAALQQQFQESAESGIKLKSQIADLEENLNNVQKQWRDLQKVHDNSMLDYQSTKRNNELLTQEKKDLSEQLEKRRNEIEKLNGEVKSLLKQTELASQAKYEAIAASEEAKLKESNLQHQVNRLEQEKVLLTRQIEDLNAEISQQSHQIHTLNREKSNTVLELQSQLEQNIDELHLVQKQVTCLKESTESKDYKIDALAEKIRELNQSRSKSDEQFTLELNAQSKLVELYKKASEDNQKRVTELVRAFEEAQKLLKESSNAREEMEKHCENVENESQLQLEKMGREIAQLKENLKKAKESNLGLSAENLEVLFPTAAATSKVLHSGMTLTEMYTELVKAQDELQRQRNENDNLSQQMKEILSEIEEKTPLINQRMQEYQKTLEMNSCLRNQLATACSDFEKVQIERNDAKRVSGMFERENERLKLQVKDLNKQVQVLLKEVEEARSGFIRQSGMRYEDEAEVSSSDNATANSVISKHLVTFRNIEELQVQNQHLLAVVRDLSQQQEEMEKKISEEQAKNYESEIEKTKVALKTLETSRVKQDELLDTVIRQRDMYRVLLSSQGFSEPFLGQQESPLLKKSPQKAFSPGGDTRLGEVKSAMQQLQVEFNNYKKEKTENERLLNVHFDKLRSEISELRIQNSKLSSQSEYSEERVSILQTNSENFKKECQSLREKNKKHSSLITQHQQTINTLRQDMLIAQEKLAKSQVSLENVKAERDLLRGIEARLLHEKESAMREQQQQSRVMANLQSVQNNLERIESETKRNLSNQVDKYEKENSILKTKLENANEEYRSAVKIWEKQNKETQQKVDVEVERNRKLHEDLVDAYAQVHALKQEIFTTKGQGQASHTSEKGPDSETTPKSTPEKQQIVIQRATEMKMLKEKLNEANSKLKALQDKLDLSQKSAEQFSSMCKDLELRVAEQDEINKHLKDSVSSSLNSSSEKLLSAEKKLETMEKHNRELIEENMKLSQNFSGQSQEQLSKILELQNQIEGYKSQAETAVKTSEQAREDCLTQKRIMEETQEKYERELMQHAEAVRTLTELKEQHQNCTSEIQRLQEITKAAQHTLQENKESLEEREKILAHECKSLRSRLVEVEKCNTNLHDQLELMGTQMAALQSKSWEGITLPSVEADLKDTQHLLEVIQFIKKEKEIISTQYDAAKSESVRLSLKVEHLTNELNESKTELKELQSRAEAKASSDGQHSELLRKVEMLNLLTDSNNLLRMEKESLSEAKEKLETQVHVLERKIQPLHENNKRMSSELDTLSAENEALRAEVKSWQSRTNQLLEQSHRIGPQEYKNLMREIEELKSQKTRLVEELQRKQAEISQFAANISAANKDQEKLKNELNGKTQEVARMNEANVEHQKTVLQIKKIGRKYKTQYDELKVQYEELLAKSQASDSARVELANVEIQKRIDDLEKIKKELQEELERQKEVAFEAKTNADTVEAKANEKEEKAKRLLTHVRQKYSQLTNAKNSITEEKNKLQTELDNLRKERDALKLTGEIKVTFLEDQLKAIKEQQAAKEHPKTRELKNEFERAKKAAEQARILSKPCGAGMEPLTANIKPLTAPLTSGTGPGLRHSVADPRNRPTELRHSPIAIPTDAMHPRETRDPRSRPAELRHSGHTVSTDPRTRLTPTASIRPMAIGQASASTPPRMATVPPTVTPHSEEASPVCLPQATVQPTPATATPKAPATSKTPAATITPHTVAISEVIPLITLEDQENAQQPESLQNIHLASTTPVTALVSPRIEISDASADPVVVDSPSPTTSVIVSPPATQTQVVTPTVKRQREESPGAKDKDLSIQKRIRMVSEGSQTSQRPVATTPPTNVAVVAAAAQIRNQPAQSTSTEVKETPIHVATTSSQPTDADTIEVVVVSPSPVDTLQTGALDAEDKDVQIIEWEAPEDNKIDGEYEVEVLMDEVVDDIEEVEVDAEDDEQIQEIQSLDEDMGDEQTDVEEMGDQPTHIPTDIDILDSGSDTQMDAESANLQAATDDQTMAPPTFPIVSEPPLRSEPVPEVILIPPTLASVQRSPLPHMAGIPERLPSGGRQHLTPFTIPGQGSNFEEGDDSIVPSTPTLYVPRRSDGFAEAVSSPHVPQQRFLFSSSESSPTQQGLSQLATQGALGVDDTRMDLSQFDEGGGRTVPSTPALQVSPPAEATVPEVSDAVLEQAVSTSIEFTAPVPLIKVDLVDDPDVNTTESTSKVEASEIQELDNINVIKADTKDISDKTEESLLGEATSSEEKGERSQHIKMLKALLTTGEIEVSEIPASGDNKEKGESSLNTKMLKTLLTRDETEESEISEIQDNKDNASSSQTTQRKPIVWKKEDIISTPPAQTTISTDPPISGTSSTVSPLPQASPTRGRGRPRRVRYQGSGSYTRGGGPQSSAPQATWIRQGTARRSRPSGRRRSMY